MLKKGIGLLVLGLLLISLSSVGVLGVFDVPEIGGSACVPFGDGNDAYCASCNPSEVNDQFKAEYDSRCPSGSGDALDTGDEAKKEAQDSQQTLLDEEDPTDEVITKSSDTSEDATDSVEEGGATGEETPQERTEKMFRRLFAGGGEGAISANGYANLNFIYKSSTPVEITMDDGTYYLVNDVGTTAVLEGFGLVVGDEVDVPGINPEGLSKKTFSKNAEYTAELEGAEDVSVSLELKEGLLVPKLEVEENAAVEEKDVKLVVKEDGEIIGEIPFKLDVQSKTVAKTMGEGAKDTKLGLIIFAVIIAILLVFLIVFKKPKSKEDTSVSQPAPSQPTTPSEPPADETSQVTPEVKPIETIETKPSS